MEEYNWEREAVQSAIGRKTRRGNKDLFLFSVSFFFLNIIIYIIMFVNNFFLCIIQVLDPAP